MSDFNPYAAPKTDIAELDPHLAEEGDLWRDGHLLVMRKGTELPDRCLRCNEPAEGYRLRRTLAWHRPGWYLLIFLHIIIYIIVALCVRWTARVSAPFCPRHRSKRRRAIAVGWLGSLAGIGLIVFGVSSDPSSNNAIASGIGILLFLASLISGVVISQMVVPQRIDKNFVWLKKVSPDFLAALPEWR